MSKQRLESVLAEFKAPGVVKSAQQGPVVTTYLVELGAGVRVRKVAALEDDIALRLGASSCRVVPNVPGLPYVGIEIPQPVRKDVPWVPASSGHTLPLSLGVDTLGRQVTVDLAKAPHVLVAGSTGSGKSVCIHTMIYSIMRSKAYAGFILVDPKQLEFQAYKGHPHLFSDIITSPNTATVAMNQLCEEMESRYTLFAKRKCRDIAEYNEEYPPIPYVVVVIDEWADLFAMQKDAIVLPVVRLAQKARACGIHLVLATQRPSVKVLPGLIKANFPARIALSVTNMTDSRVVLDKNGAERLLGRGDMLVQGFGLPDTQRVHGSYVDPYEMLG